MTTLAYSSQSQFNLNLDLSFSRLVEKREENWLEAILTGDDQQIARLYQKFMPTVIGMIRKNKGDQEDAQDVFQDAIMLIYQKAQNGEINQLDNFKAYLLKVCKYTWMNKLRRKHNRDMSIDSNTFVPVAEDHTNIEEYLHQQEMNQLYREKFQMLEDWQQQILQLCFAGKKMKEVARIMGLSSEGYAKKKKFLAKKRLIELIQADVRYRELVG